MFHPNHQSCLHTLPDHYGLPSDHQGCLWTIDFTEDECLLHPDHQSCLQTITGCLRTINYGNLVVCCIRIIKVASRPSRVASGPSISRKFNICCIRTIKVASGSSRVASGPSELPPDHVRKKFRTGESARFRSLSY